jgi:hypothetical protein
LHLRPWKELDLCNVVLGATSSGDGRILMRGRPDLAGKGRGSGVDSPRVPFEAVQRSEEVPEWSLAAQWIWRPPLLLLRGTERLARARDGGGSSRGFKRRRKSTWMAAKSGWEAGSACSAPGQVAAAKAWRRCREWAKRADGMGDADEGNDPTHLTYPALVLRLACQVARTHGAAWRCLRHDPARGRRMHHQPACARCTKECEAECTGCDCGPQRCFPASVHRQVRSLTRRRRPVFKFP